METLGQPGFLFFERWEGVMKQGTL